MGNIENYILQCLIIENPIRGYEDSRNKFDLENLYDDTSIRICTMIVEDHKPPGYALYQSLVDEFGSENINKIRMDAVYERISNIRIDTKQDLVKELSR
jgi:hypothetical protein